MPARVKLPQNTDKSARNFNGSKLAETIAAELNISKIQLNQPQPVSSITTLEMNALANKIN